MLTDVINELTHEITIPKLVVGFIAYGIIHGAYRIITRLEKAVIDEAIVIIKYRKTRVSRTEPVQQFHLDLPG